MVAEEVAQKAETVNAVIVIPAYNSASTIAATLNSLQENEDLHKIKAVLVLDDASTDGTAEVAKNAWRPTVPFEVVANPQNLGTYATTNLGLMGLPAATEWALILHADDVVKPNWISLYVDAIGSCCDEVATICASYDDWDPQTGRIDPGEEFPDRPPVFVPGTPDAVVNTLSRGCWWHISGCAIRMRAFHQIGPFEPDLPQCGDWEWLLRCLSGGHSVLYLPRSVMLYRHHSKAISSQSFRRGRDIEERLKIYKAYGRKGYLTRSQYRRQLISALGNVCRRTLVRTLRRDISGVAHHIKLLANISAQLSAQISGATTDHDIQ